MTPVGRRPIRVVLVVVLGALLLLLQGIPQADASPSGGSVRITGGNGSHAKPYSWNLSKNHRNMVIPLARISIEVYGQNHLLIAPELLVSNVTTSHWDGDNTKTTYSIRWVVRCTGPSYDVNLGCQHVGMTPQLELTGGSLMHDRFICNSSCPWYSYNWSGMRSNVQHFTGGIYAEHYKLWNWQWQLTNIWVTIRGHATHIAGVETPWYQAHLYT